MTNRYPQTEPAGRGAPSRRGTIALVWVAVLVIFAATMPPTLVEAQGRALEDISYSALPGNRLQIQLRLSGPAPEPGSFTTDNPARLAIDLPNTGVALERSTKNIGVGVARSVRAVEAGGRTRVVLNLVRLVPHDIAVEGNRIVITLDSSGAAEAGRQAPPAAAAEGRVPAQRPADTLTNVDFRRGEHGEGRIVVTLSDPKIPVDIREKGDQVLVDFLGTAVPETLERRLNVLDFGTPVKAIDTFEQDGRARMVISTVAPFQHLAYQTGDTFTVEVQPITEAKEEEKKKEESPYTGERLSLNFQNIEVRAVLQLLADFTGLNMVTSDTVGGSLTLRLKNVPWDQALDIILKTKGLDMRRMGNVILVAPAEEIAAREKMELEAQQQIQELAPLYSESIQINYAKALELAALLKREDNSLLSERGDVTIDARTNKLLVRDTAENLEQIRRLVDELDVPVRQVLIESRIVLATDDFSNELGARFGVTDAVNSNTVTSGNLNATTQAINGDTITAPDRFNVNLPVTNLASSAGTIGLAVAELPLGTIIELELSAAQAEGRSETISSPRVITANQKEAFIEQGVEIPYQQATSSGATSVSFKKAVLSLRVTPQVTPDDRIIMDLTVNKDSPDFAQAVLGQPPINTQELSTQVLVENGQTVVLGGVYEQTKSEQVNRVPFFSDLPLLGHLFQNRFKQDDKSELLIFVTPKVLKEGLAAE